MSSLPQLFGLLPAGSGLVVEPVSLDASTSSITYHVPVKGEHPFEHLAVFLLPAANPSLPAGKAASVYISLAGRNAAPQSFQFVGGVGPGKESGVFKVSSAQAADGVVVVGIAIEDEGVVSGKVAERKARAAAEAGGTGPAGGAGPAGGETTLQLAQRIITNVFNHLASHGQQLNGVEMVPLKAFQDWWQKFEARVRSDPTFLERPRD